jgi:DNA-binding beta-propeller fold protein YncE
MDATEEAMDSTEEAMDATEEAMDSTEEAMEPIEAPEIPGMETVATGLNGPQGVLVDPDGNIWVVDAGLGGDEVITMTVEGEEGPEEAEASIGETAQLVKIDTEGEQTVVTTLPSIAVGMETSGGARLALQDGVLYATVGAWIEGSDSERPDRLATIVSVDEDGTVTEVANTWDLESEENPDGFLAETHPYGLVADPNAANLLVVTDAGGNSLLNVDVETGEVTLLATFDGIPSEIPNPARGDALESDPVPTGAAYNEEGNLFVSLLSGFPFTPGSSKVVQVSEDGTVSDYATDLTMTTDLRLGPDGSLYAVQFGEFSEEGPIPFSGAIVRILPDGETEIAVEGLSFPTSIDFNADGDAYIAVNGVGEPGSGEVVMIPSVAEVAAE